MRRRARPRDWFERLTGFVEDGHPAARLIVDRHELVSTVNGKRYSIGELTLPTLAELRRRSPLDRGRRTRVSALVGDARALHADPEFEGALFQVASQFNLLEMPAPHVTPEHGVTGYAHDHTQGPACAMAAGAATIYRNYFVPIGDSMGQTADRQVDALAGLGAALAQLTGLPPGELWTMRNGYALCTAVGLTAINGALGAATPELIDELRGRLAIGLHRDVEVTDVSDHRQLVSQAFCSALPVGYSTLAQQDWEPFARLVLEATYEATLLACAEQAGGGGSDTVLLTRVGGGVFGNHPVWIDHALERALAVVEHAGLDVRIVGHREVPPAVHGIIHRWNGGR
ncbi:hypothetical protein B1R94_04590 [Mycolicibacterium litorale]|nr:hypothetical protein B1R94_04590 [Mycolicibacterium litorale]